MRVMIQWHTFFSNLPLAVDQSPISTEFAASFLGGFNRARDKNFYSVTKQIAPRFAKLTEKAKSTTTVKPH